MFGFVARHKRLLQLLLVIFIVPPFAFWGIDSYQRSFSAAGDVANVEGQKISEQEFGEQLKQQQDRMRSLLGAGFNAAEFDTPEMRARILDSMIAQRLLLQQAVRGNMAVTDEQLREVIASTAAFQEGNRFSRERYEETLRREGYTPATFEAGLRRDLVLQQYTGAINDSGIASRAASRQIAASRAEQREASEYTISAEPFASKVKIEPQAVQAYYDANRSRFLIPEQIRAEYVVFSSEAMLALEPIAQDEIKSWYESHIDQYQEKEERRASHILIAVKAGASDADKAKAREKAQSLLDQVRGAPASFGELAKKNSDDPGSASKGGDLGYFSRGMMVRAFEEAAFGLKANETSGLVESEFGFHIIRVTGIKPAKGRSLEQVRTEIERELKKQRAGRKFAEAAETFSNLVYEQPDSLKPVAEKYKIAVQTSGWVTRQSAPVQVLNNQRVLSALFTDEAIKNRHNTEALEVAPGTLVSARVIERRPAMTRPIEEVRSDIVRQLTQKEAAALAHKQGLAKLGELRKGNAGAVQFGPAGTVSREDPKGVSPESLAAIFRADRTKLPAYAGVALPSGYVVLRISKVTDVDIDQATLKNLQAELGRATGTQEFQAFLASLRANAKVEVNKALLEKKTSP
jgi:peptidyl-prolyl cis-trans isomerase D